MLTLARRLGITALTAVGLLGLTALTAQAQVRDMPNSQSLVNPYFRVAPGLPLNQAAFNVGTDGTGPAASAPLGLRLQSLLVADRHPVPEPAHCPLTRPSRRAASGAAQRRNVVLCGRRLSRRLQRQQLTAAATAARRRLRRLRRLRHLPDPFAGYMSGAAQIIGAQSQFMTSQAQAEQTREQTRQMRIDTHRRILEEWQYERNLLANVPDPRIQEQKFALNRALNDPPLTEILTGDALNAIANNIVKLQNNGAVAPQVPLDDEMLRAVNFSDGEPGNIGLLKNGGKLKLALAAARGRLRRG